MSSNKGNIEPHRITKPIQLLAAWLLGLVFTNGAFLLAASQIKQPDWVSATLALASIFNVPVFLAALFLLQTRFRPEMQEDSFYSKYLESKMGNTESEITSDSFVKIREDIAQLENIVAEKVLNGISEDNIEKIKWSSVTVMLNKNLKNFTALAQRLNHHGVPVHETFGAGARVPGEFAVAMGSGFDVDQIRKIVNAVSEITDGWIAFAHREDEEDYQNQVLIGSYGDSHYGIEIEKIRPLLEREDISKKEVYELIGIGRH